MHFIFFLTVSNLECFSDNEMHVLGMFHSVPPQRVRNASETGGCELIQMKKEDPPIQAGSKCDISPVKHVN